MEEEERARRERVGYRGEGGAGAGAERREIELERKIKGLHIVNASFFSTYFVVGSCNFPISYQTCLKILNPLIGCHLVS